MSNQRASAIIYFIFIFLICSAQRIDETTALAIGKDFLNKKQSESSDIQRVQTRGEYELAYTATRDGKDCFYVYNRIGGGYVIVSADDRTSQPVLGYSTNGIFNYDKLGDNVRGFIDSFEKYILSLDSVHISSPQHSKKVPTQKVTPLLGDNLWHQGSPYNSMCPEIDGERTPTGCVANAMSQVMWYHKWPEHGQGYVSYDWRSGNTTLSVDLSKSNYRWDLIKSQYQSNENNEATEAVGRLLRDTGYSVLMNYSRNGSGTDAYLIKDALIKNFDYSSLSLSYNNLRNISAWESIIQKEINEGRPVIYSGYSPEYIGHSFVCDGSDGDGYFHFNFGWGGEANGYYLTSDNLYTEQPMINIGVAPRHKNPNIYYFLCWDSNNNLELNPYSKTIDLHALVSSSLNVTDPIFDFAMAKENISTGNIEYEFLYSATGMLSTYTPDASGLEDGIYHFYPVGRYLDDDWQRVIYSTESSQYVELEVKNEEIVWPVEQGQWTIDGITYLQVDEETVKIINVIPDESGTVRIPDEFITIEGKKYNIGYYVHIEAIQELKTLILPFYYATIAGCSNLSNVIFTSSKPIKAIFYSCPGLTNISLPDNVSYIYLEGIDSVKEIDIQNAHPCLEISTIGLNSTTAYNLHSTTPPSLIGRTPSIDKGLITFNIPFGYKKVYETHGFAGYNLIEKFEPTSTNSIEFGYNPGREIHPFGLGFGYGSSGELSILLDKDALKPYIGKKITGVNYCVSEDAPPSYIFISDSNPGCIKQSPIKNNFDNGWQSFIFPDSYTITENPIYVGVGFKGRTLATFTSSNEYCDKYFFRGESSNNEWMPIGLICSPMQAPIALSVTIEGEDLPIDMYIHKINCNGINTDINNQEAKIAAKLINDPILIDYDVCEFQLQVQNRSLERVENVTVAIQLNGGEIIEKDIPYHMGPNMISTISFTIPFENMPVDNIVNLDVTKVNGKMDNIPNPIEILIENVSSLLTYPKTNVVEGYIWESDALECSSKVIQEINRINSENQESLVGTLVVEGFNTQTENYELYVVPDGFGDNGYIKSHFEISRKLAFAALDAPDFESFINHDNLSYGLITNSPTLNRKGLCDNSSKVKIAYDAKGSDFTIAYILVENNVPLDNWNGEMPNSIARGIYPDNMGMGIVMLPSNIKGDETYNIHQSFTVPDFILNKDNLEVIAILLNKRGEIINAHKSKVIYDDSGIYQVEGLDNPTTYDIYNLEGITIRKNTTTLEGLPAGLYIIRKGNETFKINIP